MKDKREQKKEKTLCLYQEVEERKESMKKMCRHHMERVVSVAPGSINKWDRGLRGWLNIETWLGCSGAKHTLVNWSLIEYLTCSKSNDLIISQPLKFGRFGLDPEVPFIVFGVTSLGTLFLFFLVSKFEDLSVYFNLFIYFLFSSLLLHGRFDECVLRVCV